jgi:hypothetical protein
MAQESNLQIEQIQKGFLVERLDSWEDFIEFAKDEKKCWPTLIFRGQANAQWKLHSRLDRLEMKYNTTPNLGDGVPDKFECPRVDRDTHLKRFRELALDKIGKDVEDDVLWTIAQHHGLATPLLDFTYSPFVALFFAFEEEKCWYEKDGVSTFQEPSNRAVFTLTHHLVEDLIRPFSAPGYGNYRAASQGGLFLKMPDPQHKYPDKWDLESYIKEKCKGGTYKKPPDKDANLHPQLILRKFEITNQSRIECLKFLDQMNINRASLFPDLDGVAKHVNDLWEVNFDKALGHIEQLYPRAGKLGETEKEQN